MGSFSEKLEKLYSEMPLSMMRDYQLNEFLSVMETFKEPGPRDWSPRTDPRYSRKAASRG
jgi:hypothetical protein